MIIIHQPLIDISTGFARYLWAPPRQEPGHNFSNEVGNVDAADDWDAVLAFLNEYRHSPKTFRSYAAELERLSLWLIHIRQIPLSGLKRADLAEYYEFLRSPPASWCAASAKKFRRDGTLNPHWRPFKVGVDAQVGLGASSVQRVQKILQSLFTYLVDEGYLLGNPATTRRTRGQRPSKMNTVERYLQPHEAAFVGQVLRDALARAEATQDTDAHFKALRRCYVYDLFLHTGLRISEPVHYTMGDIQIRGSGDKKTLALQVCGKGSIEGENRTVALGRSFVEILKAYRLALNVAMKNKKNWTPLDPLPGFEEGTPLIPDMSGRRPIGDRQISNIFGEIRELCVAAVDLLLTQHNEPERAGDLMRMRSTLASFTCHWMRHTHATYFLALSGDLRATQDRLGHADLSTTQIYVHLLDQSKSDAADKFDPQQMANLL